MQEGWGIYRPQTGLNLELKNVISRISGVLAVMDKLLNKMFDVMLMYVRVFWYVHALYSM